jgi:hypothetical protein
MLYQLDCRVGTFRHIQSHSTRFQRKCVDDRHKEQGREEDDNARKKHLETSQQTRGKRGLNADLDVEDNDRV